MTNIKKAIPVTSLFLIKKVEGATLEVLKVPGRVSKKEAAEIAENNDSLFVKSEVENEIRVISAKNFYEHSMPLTEQLEISLEE